MPQVDTDIAHELVDAIFVFGRTLRAVMTHSEPDQLPSALAGVLFLLSRRGECRPSELAAEMYVSQSALSRSLGELVELGFIDRKPDPDDRRAHRISCSPTGIEALRQLRERRIERMSAELVDWNDEQLAHALDVVDRLNVTMAPLAQSACADTHTTPVHIRRNRP